MRKVFERLMAIQDISSLTTSQTIKGMGVLIDLAKDLSRPLGTRRALLWAETLRQRKLTPQQAVLVEYFTANAWHNLKRVRDLDVGKAWAWEQPEILHQIFHLRRATHMSGFARLSPLRQCQIYTNLANQLSNVGRVIEARRIWKRALVVNPQFGYALGNRGSGLVRFAEQLYDPAAQRLILCAAHKELNAALASSAQYRGGGRSVAKDYFAERIASIERHIPADQLQRPLDLDRGSLGNSPAEKQYRSWALREGLFLNPLNELGAHAIAARDTLSLPDFQTPLMKPPTLIGFFNQLKQEYVFARLLLYEGLHDNKRHYSDRAVTLYNTLDYPSYGVRLEKVRAAFRLAYSLFDKIGYFLNDYMQLGQEPRQVYFRTIWYPDKNPASGIRPQLDQSRNISLRALFWLAKDIFDPNLTDVMNPDAKHLDAIRNQLEHGYLKIHEFPVPKSAHGMWSDTLAYSVVRSDFEAKTLQVLRLARSAMLYLVFGMRTEEQGRVSHSGGGPIVPMSLPLYSEDR